MHLLGVGSPPWKAVDLERHGLSWCYLEVDCAHPSTTAGPGSSTSRCSAPPRGWAPTASALVGDLAAHFDDLSADLLGPVISIPSHPFRLAAFGPRAVPPASVVGATKTDTARAAYGGRRRTPSPASTAR